MSRHIVLLNKDVDACGAFSSLSPSVAKANSRLSNLLDRLFCWGAAGRAQRQQSSPVFLQTLSVLYR